MSLWCYLYQKKKKKSMEYIQIYSTASTLYETTKKIQRNFKSVKYIQYVTPLWSCPYVEFNSVWNFIVINKITNADHTIKFAFHKYER